jgi:RimJ/RimL family protein N-acetyltransferase
VILRPYTGADAALTEALETDPVVKLHLGGVLTAAEAARVHRHRMAGSARGDRYWTIAGPEPAGVVGIWSTPWGDGSIDEVGWMLLPAFHGRGLGAWAAGAVVDRARADDRYSELHAFPAVANPASNAICRRLGFRRLDDVDLDYADRPLRCAHWVLPV